MPDAYLRLDAYVVDVLMADLVGHDKRPSAFIVYLFLWRRVATSRARAADVSLAAIAEGTGLSKRGVQDALRLLVRRRLVDVERKQSTAIPRYTVRRPWRRPTKRP